jgi:uncharacterized membrane protein YbhN (UPF0104 family)
MKTTVKIFLDLLGIALFIAAIGVLWKELRLYRPGDILAGIVAVTPSRLAAAALLTGVNYLVVAVYDVLAFSYIRRTLRIRDIMTVSFISTALKNNIGYSMLTGGSVRYRLYSAYGVPLKDVTKVLLFVSATLWLGLLTLAGAVFMASTFLPKTVRTPLASSRTTGILFVSIVVLYLALSFLGRTKLRIGRRKFRFPSPHIAAAQIAVSSADWLLVACVLYLLLPATPVHFLTFLGMFCFAQFLGIISQVPGGIGVFETVIFLLFPNGARAGVISALIVFRTLYYVLPLCTALLLLGRREYLRHRRTLHLQD